MKLSDFNIIYLTKKSNLSRQEHMEHILNSASLKYTKIYAIDGYDILEYKYRRWLSNTLKIPLSKLNTSWLFNNENFKRRTKVIEKHLLDVGCFLSHMCAIKYAYDNSWENVLIIEDDADLLEHMETIEFKIPENSTILYFGGLFQKMWSSSTIDTKGDWIRINPEEIKIHGSYSYGIIGEDIIKNYYNSFQRVFKDEMRTFDTIRRFCETDGRIRGSTIDCHLQSFYQKQRNCYIKVMFGYREIYINDLNISGLSFIQRYKGLFNKQTLNGDKASLRFRNTDLLQQVAFN